MDQERKRGISGSALKLIAIFTMLVDHAAAVLLVAWAHHRGSWGGGVESIRFYYFLRGVGRLAFPIFCFLLVEGFLHTRSRLKYLARLILFGIVSEVPFDLAFHQQLFDPTYQNVYFTLALGLLALIAWERVGGESGENRWSWRRLGALVLVGLCVLAGELGETDYGGYGVALIFALYLLRKNEVGRDLVSAAILYLTNALELVACVDFALFHFYNGQRGRQMKYLFYVFYPAHLLLLIGVRYLLFRV